MAPPQMRIAPTSELQAAGEVQARLQRHAFPRTGRSIEIGVQTSPANHVGGDFADVIDAGPGRIVVALGDVSGKGIAAALIAACLQTALRSQFGAPARNLGSAVRSIHELLYASTAPQHYATLFVGEYRERVRKLRYVNCGHPPPFLVRRNGEVERLGASTTILGAFDGWRSRVVETSASPGDTLLLYSDGVTEAIDPQGRDLGQVGLVSALLKYRSLPVEQLIERVAATVRKFSAKQNRDDVTLLAVRFV